MSLKLSLKVRNLLKLNRRNFTTQRTSQEIQIPLPYGHLAGKWWGPEDKRPILAFHGWQDNSGSFDRLIPLLPPHVPILALDSLGHGWSSQLPIGMAYHNVDQCIITKQLKSYFGWDRVSLMGHSMGGIIAFTYTFLFPQDVDLLICIDRIYPLISSGKDRIARSIEQHIKYDEVNNQTDEPPCYTFDEMVNRVNVATKKSVDVDVAKYILYRNIAPSKRYPGKFFFNRDARTKVGPLEYQDPVELVNVASKVACPVFVSRAKESLYFGRDLVFNDLCNVLKRSSKDFQFYEVEGTHHTHLNDPVPVSTLITNFILKHDNEERVNGGLKDELKIDESVYPMFKYKKHIFE